MKEEAIKALAAGAAIFLIGMSAFGTNPLKEHPTRFILFVIGSNVLVAILKA